MSTRSTFQNVLRLRRSERTEAQSQQLYRTITTDTGLLVRRREGPHNHLDTEAAIRAVLPVSSLYKEFSLAVTRIAPFNDDITAPVMFTMATVYGAGRVIMECPGVPPSFETSIVVGVGEVLAPGLPEDLWLPEEQAREKLVQVVKTLSSDVRVWSLLNSGMTNQLVQQGSSLGLPPALHLAVGDAGWPDVAMTPFDAMQILLFYAEVIMDTNALVPVIMLTNNMVATVKKGAATRAFIDKVNNCMQADLSYPADIVRESIVLNIYKAYGRYMNSAIAKRVITDWQNWIPANALRLQLTVNQAVAEGLTAFTTVERAVKTCPSFSWSALAGIPAYAGVQLRACAWVPRRLVQETSRVAIEAITNIRTVASLGKEQSLLDLYDKELLSGERTMHIKSVMRGFAFALGQTAPFVCYGISLWYGGVLVADEGLHYKNVIKVSEALLYGAWVLGQSLAFAPNFLAAKLSAARIFKILDRTPKISDGIMRQDPNWQTDGHVSFNQVKFAYPTRPEAEVLKGLDLDIQKGLSIALAGQSGCGKSTIIQLLQKLYDPLEGKIYLDDLNLSDMEISKLRKQFGLVSQEPVLFDRTIAENIAYGDNTRKVPHCDIIAAAKSANIHDFISCLPLGYETRLGAGGAQLSGGQKQRIAIARALVRNPKILLLDEATSALDPASESVVQAALDSAVEGRTTITIGHRPGAVLRADVIYFLDQGRITEKGTHEELLRAKGKYADMHFHDKS